MTGIFGATFTYGWETGLLDDESWLAAFLEVESALLRACAVAGAVPEEAAVEIEMRWAEADLDFGAISAGAGAGHQLRGHRGASQS